MRLRRVLDELASGRFCPQDRSLFQWIRDSLLERDDYFVLADFGSYVDTQTLVSSKFLERESWARSAVLNIARIGRFSSDRTVTEYARDIWHLNQV
jgi:starch phosphorylase